MSPEASVIIMKFLSKLFTCSFLSVLLLTPLASCGGDEPNEPDKEEVGGDTNRNPMQGKTISCVEDSDNGTMRISTNFTIHFVDERFYTQTLKQVAKEQDWATGSWNTIQNLNKTIEGTYEYSSTKIILKGNDGTTKTLTKSGNGWKDGSYLYK